MNIFNEIPDNRGIFKNPVLTIGTFDGVHGGHQKILQTLVTTAKSSGSDPVVLTFDAHPRKILTPATPPKILTTAREKTDAIAGYGIENIIMLKFTREIAGMTAEDFLNRMIIDRIGVEHLVVGFDHAFGKDRGGDFNFLRESGSSRFGITRVEARNFHSKRISSTWIRAEIEDGNISFANMLLGRRYSLSGTVVKGDGRGAEMGFPTANVMPDDPDKVIPKDGVYAVKVVIGGRIKKDGMLNIGKNPTFSNTERTIEVNILDFNSNIYNETIEIEFFERIRDEVRFASMDALKEQIGRDKDTAVRILREEISRNVDLKVYSV